MGRLAGFVILVAVVTWVALMYIGIQFYRLLVGL